MDPVTMTKAVESTPEILGALTKLTEVFGRFIEKETVRTQDTVLESIKVAVYRQPQGKFQQQFAEWTKNLVINNIIFATQSESDGNVTITLFYR